MAQKLSQKAIQTLQQNLNKNKAVSSTDSLKHMFGKMFDFENKQGSATGGSVPNFGYNESQLPYDKVPSNWTPPKTKQEAIELLYKEMSDRLHHYPSAMEKAEATDFIFNSGRDPRPYMVDQYLKRYKNQKDGIPNLKEFNKNIRKDKWTPELQNKVDSIWNAHKDEIMKLPTNDRRILMNQGRDYYYQRTYRGEAAKDGKPATGVGVWNWGFDKNGEAIIGPDGTKSPAYGKSWKDRINKSVNNY